MKKKWLTTLAVLLTLALAMCAFTACNNNSDDDTPTITAYTDGAFVFETPGTASSTVFVALKEDGTYYKDAFGTPSAGTYAVNETAGTITFNGSDTYDFDQDDYLVGADTTENTDGVWVIHQYDYAGWPVDFLHDAEYDYTESAFVIAQYWDATDDSGNSTVILQSDNTFTYMYINSEQPDTEADDYYLVATGAWTQSSGTYTLTATGATYTLTVGETVTLKKGSDAAITLAKFNPAKKELFEVSGAAKGANSWDSGTILLYDNGECVFTTSTTQQNIKGSWALAANNYSRVITWETNAVLKSQTFTMEGTPNVDYSKIEYADEFTIDLGDRGEFTYELSGVYFAPTYVKSEIVELVGDAQEDDGAGDWATATLVIYDNFTCNFSQATLQQNIDGKWKFEGDDIVITLGGESFTIEVTGTGDNAEYASGADAFALDLDPYGTFTFTFAQAAE